MKEYIEITTCYPQEINKKLSEGWEIIDTTKDSSDYSESIIYHLGYPASARIAELIKLLKLYENHGLKEELFKKIALDNNEESEEFIIGSSFDNYSPTAEFMTNYEKIVNNYQV